MTGVQLRRLFKPFTVGTDPQSRRKNPSGNGLGLSICKSILNAMDGHINVNSTEGIGTTFLVDFTTEIS